MIIGIKKRIRIARAYKRYIVMGPATLRHFDKECRGVLLNIGKGGLLIRTYSPFRAGPNIELLFQVAHYPEPISALVRIVGTKENLLAIKFRKEPKRLDSLLYWLQQENTPWSGVV